MIVSLQKSLNSYFNNTLGNSILSVIAGSFFVLAFAPFRIFPLFFLALFLMWRVAIRSKSLWYVILYNLLFTSTVSVCGLYWIFYAIEYIIPSYLIAGLLFLGFIILYSVVYLPTLILPYLKKENKNFSLCLAFLGWFLSEIVKLHILGGFPWFIPVQLWDFSLSLLQVISLIGVFNYSILTYLLVFMLINTFISFNYKIIGSWLGILGCLLLIDINYWYGYNRLKNKNTHVLYNIPIRIVQPNISQQDKLSYNKVNSIFKETIKLTFKDINYKHPPEYIILPEVAFNTVLEKDNIMLKELRKLLPSHSKVLLGSLTIEDNKIYNTFEIITNDLENYPIYKKMKLVPFGEYIPFSNYLTFLLPLLGMENFTAGKINVIYNINKDRFAPLICFEALFTNKLLNYSNVSWLLNISNEAWFNNSIEQEQNLALTRLRAIEGGVPLVKVSNNGVSAMVDYTGKIIYKLKPYTPNVVDINLQIITKNNIYSVNQE